MTARHTASGSTLAVTLDGTDLHAPSHKENPHKKINAKLDDWTITLAITELDSESRTTPGNTSVIRESAGQRSSGDRLVLARQAR